MCIIIIIQTSTLILYIPYSSTLFPSYSSISNRHTIIISNHMTHNVASLAYHKNRALLMFSYIYNVTEYICTHTLCDLNVAITGLN